MPKAKPKTWLVKLFVIVRQQAVAAKQWANQGFNHSPLPVLSH